MRRIPAGGLDVAMTEDMDPGFYGVDNRRDPSVLRSGSAFYDVNQQMAQTGLLADSINMRMTDGQATTRRGIFPPLHWNAGYELVQGVGIFSDPNDREWILVADRSTVWQVADGEAPLQISLPSTISGSVEFVQCFSRVLLCRAGASPLEWIGTRSQGFREIVQTVPDDERPDFLDPLPPIEWAVVTQDRVFFPVGRDGIGWSDILDYSYTDSALAVARFNTGEDDTVVAAAPYQGNRLIVFKTQSIHFMENMTPSMEAYRVDKLPVKVGCIARRTVANVNGDLFWLDAGGVFSLRQTEQNFLRGDAVPMSWPIQGWIDRIHWQAAANACATYDQTHGLYLLAVPIDGSSVNNAVLIYDTAGRQWTGMDVYGLPLGGVGRIIETVEFLPVQMLDPWYGAAFAVAPVATQTDRVALQSLVTADLFGRPTPVLCDGRRLYALGHGEQDEIDGQRREITSSIRTRGYMLGSLALKRVRALRPALATNAATLTCRAISDGWNEVVTLLDAQQRDRTRYTIWGAPSYDFATGEWEAPHREDYSWWIEDRPDIESGIRYDILQDWMEPLPVRVGTARWVALEIISTSGRWTLRAVQADGTGDKNQMRPAT